jgi:hypothetical protein
VVARLGDFGLAVALDRSRLTQAGMMVGTVHYMPPEQAMGGTVDARSDLYSLGAMLYEMVTGRPPFVGDESVAIITQHLNTPPVAPSWHVPDLPAGLEALILRLLEKDPAKRPSSTAEARQALAAVLVPTPTPPPTLGEGPRGSPLPGLGEGTGVRPADPLYRRVFIGREAELRQLQRTFDAALSGRGALTMVVGEPGIGKTAVCEQLSTYATVRGGKALFGHCYEEGSLSLPYLPFVEAMRSYVLARDPEDLKRDLGTGAGEVARILSEIRDRVALSPDPSPKVGGGAGVGASAEEDQLRLLQAVTAFLRNASSVQPLVIVLEDLHWADRATLDLLTYLSRNLDGARLLVVGTYRDVEVDRSHPLSSALAELRRGHAFERLILHGLRVPEVQRMLEAIAGWEVPPSLAEAVHRQTEGNPLFVQEVVRYLVEEGLLAREREGAERRAGGSTPVAMAIPEGLRDVIGKRLSRLSPECNRLLATGAVIGREFHLDTLRAVTTLADESVVAGLEEAVRVGVLEEEARLGQVRYRYAHAFFRQTLYEELSAPRRIQLHQQVARALEARHAARLDEHAAELAEHFAHSSDPADLGKAIAYGETAAHRAIGVFAYGEAARLLEGALEVQEVLGGEPAQRCDLLLALGDALMPAGEPQRAGDEVAGEALALAEATGDERRSARASLLALDALGRYGAATLYATPAYARWADTADRYVEPNTVGRVMADTALCAARYNTGRWADARAYIERGFALARQLGNPEALFWAGSLLVQPWWATPRQSEHLPLVEEASTWPRDGVSTRAMTLLLYQAYGIYLCAGQRERAQAAADDLEQIAARTRDPFPTLMGMVPQSAEATLNGDLEGAVALAARIAVRGEELGMAVRGEQFGSIASGRPLVYLGRLEEAPR